MFPIYFLYVRPCLRHAGYTVFIRRVQTRPRAGSAQPYASFRLVRSIRSGNSVRQLTLLNLGAHFSVPQPQWPALCELVAAIRSGRAPLIEPDPDCGFWRKGSVIRRKRVSVLAEKNHCSDEKGQFGAQRR